MSSLFSPVSDFRGSSLPIGWIVVALTCFFSRPTQWIPNKDKLQLSHRFVNLRFAMSANFDFFYIHIPDVLNRFQKTNRPRRGIRIACHPPTQHPVYLFLAFTSLSLVCFCHFTWFRAFLRIQNCLMSIRILWQ